MRPPGAGTLHYCSRRVHTAHCAGALAALREPTRPNVFAVLPTGMGKSLLFTLPALTEPGLTLVVCPLISLASSLLHTTNRCSSTCVVSRQDESRRAARGGAR